MKFFYGAFTKESVTAGNKIYLSMLKPIVALRYGQIMAEADFRSGKTLTETA
jgi:hypothetical protein